MNNRLSWLRFKAGLVLLGAPVYVVQGWWLKRGALRLPEAPRPHSGAIDGARPALRLLGIGESPLAGVGLDTAGDTVVARLGEMLSGHAGRAVEWRIVARSGVTVADTVNELLPAVPDGAIDLAVVGLGVNDCLQLTGARRWQAGLQALLDGLDQRCRPGLVLLTGVPPMRDFPALPRPLADMLGLRASMLDAAAARLASGQADLAHVPMRFNGRSAELFCADGFHPCAHGHRLWAQQLAPVALERLAIRAR